MCDLAADLLSKYELHMAYAAELCNQLEQDMKSTHIISTMLLQIFVELQRDAHLHTDTSST